jgi:hypothetical protein
LFDVLIWGGEAIILSFMRHEASSSIVQVVALIKNLKKGPKLLEKVKNGIFKASV